MLESAVFYCCTRTPHIRLNTASISGDRWICTDGIIASLGPHSQTTSMLSCCAFSGSQAALYVPGQDIRVPADWGLIRIERHDVVRRRLITGGAG